MKIWVVDAFTDTPFKGNPAAVIVVRDFPSEEDCQNIAAEMNLSETAFIKPLPPSQNNSNPTFPSNHFHLRWFTPKVEVKLCGHATLASAHILFQEDLVKGDTITFESLSGPLFVRKENDCIVLDFPLQKISHTLPKEFFKDLFTTNIVNCVQAYDDVIVELQNEDEVRKINLDPLKIKEIDCRGLIVTARGKGPYDFVSRFFAPRVGVNEDPVTGSAHCKLADYWQQKLGKKEFKAYQASQRGGTINITVQEDRILLKGKAITVMEGFWRI